MVAFEQYVVMHYLMLPDSDERGIVVGIWRMDGDQIAEHWDVVQPVPPAEQIPHGMF